MIKIIFSIFIFLSFHIVQAQNSTLISIDINSNISYQTIDNIGASSAWFTEFIGRYWGDNQRENMARWLFSRKMDKDGNPEGIGLSSFRFNIGGGTTELGDSSKIKDFRRRVECFLNSDGSYDWSKQQGYLWFVKKAKEYGVENLIAFSNTPPVSMTENGLGFKTVKNYSSNLKANKYQDFARFLINVVQHFDSVGIHFDYISPINEPQWDWYNNSQEGSPWTNEEIFHIVNDLDSCLHSNSVQTKILLPEAGDLEYLYSKKSKAGQQIPNLYGTHSVQSFKNVLNVAAGHSYYTDGNDSARINIRKSVRDTANKYGTNYWQTEYSMLGDNYKEGKSGKILAIDCALFLAKIIHDDFVYGNAKAWQFWNSCEPGNPDFDTRYFLLALESKDPQFKSGNVIPTKMLWALGNYSRFIRPGMTRISAIVQDSLSEIQQAQNVMVSAYENKDQVVAVFVNYSNSIQNVNPIFTKSKLKHKFKYYITDKNANLKSYLGNNIKSTFKLPSRSIVTLVIDKK